MTGSGAQIVRLPKTPPPKPEGRIVVQGTMAGAFGGSIAVGPINANPDVILFSITETSDKSARIILRQKPAVEFALKLLEEVFDERDRKVLRALIERLLIR